MSDELNVWREAKAAWCNPPPHLAFSESAAAVIRDYGDRRDATARSEGHAKGYQQAIADVVEWLHSENGLCDCFARSETECACGAWDDYKQWSLERTAQEITRRFGKDA